MHKIWCVKWGCLLVNPVHYTHMLYKYSGPAFVVHVVLFYSWSLSDLVCFHRQWVAGIGIHCGLWNELQIKRCAICVLKWIIDRYCFEVSRGLCVMQCAMCLHIFQCMLLDYYVWGQTFVSLERNFSSISWQNIWGFLCILWSVFESQSLSADVS
jgi:hypothetical protein